MSLAQSRFLKLVQEWTLLPILPTHTSANTSSKELQTWSFYTLIKSLLYSSLNFCYIIIATHYCQWGVSEDVKGMFHNMVILYYKINRGIGNYASIILRIDMHIKYILENNNNYASILGTMQLWHYFEIHKRLFIANCYLIVIQTSSPV